jgi:2-succinyl-5-enolpyruvyl-6-hydroxy-3-cyclohexene-1-carboxylate synthase
VNPGAVQTLWAQRVVAGLVDAGVHDVVVSPGSRSTPLVLALAARSELDVSVVIDERSAGFLALGIARVGAGPVALVCTSGSAVGHYLPAVIEASESNIPLLVISADRPAELQQAGASQTIDQQRLFGVHVRAYLDLGAPVESTLALRAVFRKVTAAVQTAVGPRPGPVHVNVPLRKPLEPAAPDRELARALAGVMTATPLAGPHLRAADSAVATVANAIGAARRGVIIAGPAGLEAGLHRDAVFELARRTGFVLVAEAGSQLRMGPVPPGVTRIEHPDGVLAAASADLVPDVIVQLGREPSMASWSTAQAAWQGAERWVLCADGQSDPDSSATGVIRGEVADLLWRLAAACSGGEARADRSADRAAHRDRWARWDRLAAGLTAQLLREQPDGEPRLLRRIVEALPAEAMVVVGNSLPIRVFDQVGAIASDHPVVCQRGASGIDGFIAGAVGATWARRPVVAILGDVSFAHDLGSLILARAARAPLAIVVVDNGGGRIFDGLPIAAVAGSEVMTRYFTTAPRLDVVAVAAALGLRAVTCDARSDLGAQLEEVVALGGTTVLHAPVSPDGARQFRNDLVTLMLAARAAESEPGSWPSSAKE